MEAPSEGQIAVGVVLAATSFIAQQSKRLLLRETVNEIKLCVVFSHIFRFSG